MQRFWWLVPVIVGGVIVGWVVLRGAFYAPIKVELPGDWDIPGEHGEQGAPRTLEPPCRDC